MTDYKQIVADKRQAMLSLLLESIEKNPTKWEKGWYALDVPYNATTGKNYNGLNSLFLDAVAQLRGYGDMRWVTFNQAKELGANIKAGEKASEIFYWSQYDKKTKTVFDGSVLEGMTADERIAYLKENVRTVLKYYSVFNAEQCTNFPEAAKRELSEDERANQNAQIEAIIANSAAPISYDGKDRAYYSIREDKIHLPLMASFKTAQDYYATALHEIGHSTGHESRLNRDLSGDFSSESYAIEELRAELASIFLQAELGLNLSGAEIANHGAYLNSWLSAVRKDANVFFKAAADAGKISDYIKENFLQAIKTQEETAVKKTNDNIDVSIKQWYVANYQSDELAQGLYFEPTFKDLQDALENGKDVYSLIGVEDTVVRERLFNQLAEMQGKNYDDVYNLWLIKAEQAKQAEKSTTQEKKQIRQIEMVFPREAIVNAYGKATMLKLPKGSEYSSFVFLAPTKFLHEESDNVRLVVPSNFEFTIKNDGRELRLTSEDLRTVLEGKEIGKRAQRSAPSKRTVERLEALERNVPAEMKEMPNWCVYRTKWNEEHTKKEKFVLSAHDGKWARINDRATWTDFGTAYKYALENGCEGLTFALDGSGITCIDLDKCIASKGQINGVATEKADGELNDVAKQLVPAMAETYCERSASGNGLHFFLRDDVLARGTIANRATLAGGDELEVYDSLRFISMTGDLYNSANKLGKCPMQTISWLRTALGARKRASEVAHSVGRQTTSWHYQSDSEVVARIRSSRKGEQFDLLYSGGSVTGDKSRDDLMMLNTLAFFTNCNEAQMRSIFESSARFRPETKNRDYVSRSIRKACDTLTVRINTGTHASKDKK